MEEQRKLRVLCLHGFYSNVDVMKVQIDYYQHIFGDFVQFEYVNGPVRIPEDIVVDPIVAKMFQGPFYGWFDMRKLGTGQEKESFEESYEILYKYIEENGPYDGIFAFSQACMFARCLVKGKDIGFSTLTHPFKFMILAAARLPKTFPHKDEITYNFSIPVLNIFDENDTYNEGFALDYCTKGESTLIKHHKGHRVPRLIDGDMKVFIDFINTQYFRKFGDEMKLSFEIDQGFLNEYMEQKTSAKPKRSKI
ncbi:unnamed protein product [Moneuplotes crassus]|uniref:Serine hydrolase domain-containing protein n=1 Tax=Euplotes crassus TaxID=5936 RepID=A0AAD1XPN0_EUPCR|nr:unnamed protein product [Moneuplotes crassus]